LEEGAPHDRQHHGQDIELEVRVGSEGAVGPYMNKYWSPGELATVYKTKFDNDARLRTASYIQPTGPEVDLRIENENILKHEAPVCLELNEQVRWQYWDNKKPN
jgi:hypothetical protein